MHRFELSDSKEMADVPGGTFGLFLGFFYTLNIVVGTGFLGMPYAILKAGVLVSGLAMLVIVFFAVVTTLWVLEAMSRAQALEHHQKTKASRPSVSCNFVDVGNESEDSEKGETEGLLRRAAPTYEIRSDRKFDFPELCHLFLGPVGKYVYTSLFCLGAFLNLWTMATIAASAWSTNVVIDVWPFTAPCKADPIAPRGGFHPVGNCWNNYALFVFVFALLVVPLSMLDLKKQRVIQVTAGVMRIVVVIAIVIYSIVQEVNGATELPASSGGENDTVPWISGDGGFVGFLVALPIFSYSLALQVNVPTLSQPMEPKRKLKAFYIWLNVFLVLFYFVLGVAVLAYLKSDVKENCTLNWVDTTSSGHSLALRIFSYIVVIFPSFDVCSGFPLAVAILSNAIHSLLGHDSSTSHELESNTTRMVYRAVCAALPLIGACFITNFSVLLRYEGLLTFALFFLFPALVHYSSSVACRKTFGLPPGKSSVKVKTISYNFYGDGGKEDDSKEVDYRITPYSTVFSGLWMVPVVVCFTLFEIGGTLAGLIVHKSY
eukprot:m.125378 g.125378  ORF g.125378 m.125378 type:complete len:545 (+) comp37872_c0_seq2:145-1779(+)